MAAHSNRSPSPLSSRPINPNPRNPENIPAPRRSFTGHNPSAKPSALTNPRRFDPTTPANSPSDVARRRSVGKDSEEKENDDKDNILKAARLQSPAKGCKNFMSPTISAASKFTPSPRKKVLVERNDPVRTSISLSDGKAVFFGAMSSTEDLDPKSEMGYHQNPKLETSLESNAADLEKRQTFQEDPPVPKPSKRVTFSDVPSDSQPVTESLSESVITDTDSDSLKLETSDSDSLKLETSVKNNVSFSSTSPSIAPLDADPSSTPYDPKTNYLSPRPQFLHYKPNPRIEILMNKEKGLDPDEFERLEDRLMAEIMSDNLSDSECTEESQTEGSDKTELEAPAPEDTVIGAEEIDVPHISEDMVIGAAEIDVPHISESSPVSTVVTNTTSEDNFVQKTAKKPWAVSRLICISVLLMFLVAFISISVTYPPPFNEFVLKELSSPDLSDFYHQSRVAAAAAKVHFDRLARHVYQLSVNSISFISRLADELGKGGKVGPLQYVNLSNLQTCSWNRGNLLSNEEDLEEDELEEDMDTEVYAFEGETYSEADFDEDFEKELDTHEDNDVLEIEEVFSDSVKLYEVEFEYSEETQREDVVSSTNLSPEQLGAIPQDQDSELLEAAVETVTSHGETNLGSSGGGDTSLDHQSPTSDVDSLNDESVRSSLMLETPPSANKSLAQYYVMGVSSLFAALVAVAAAFLFRYKKSPNSANNVQAEALSSQQISPAFTSTKLVYQEKTFSENWQTEVDDFSESCPSEMSSYQNNASSYSKKELRGASEAQSIERKTRRSSKRESLASSSTEYSMGSPSYGSFTTFERIPIKHANGEEEIITPVRRSSRIRNHQITSP